MVRSFEALWGQVVLLAAFVAAASCCSQPAPADVGAGADTFGPGLLREGDCPPWSWRPEEADLEYSRAHALAGLKTLVEAGGTDWRSESTLVITCEDGQILRVGVHGKTPIVRVGDQIFVASYPLMSEGCAIECYDVAHAKHVWTRDLMALGQIAHSKYFNAVTLEVEGKNLIVRGQETAGRYIEVLTLRDGAEVMNRVL